MVTQRTAARIVPRKLDFDFGGVPLHWFGGSVLGSHMGNALNLVFPAGERFFVRSVRYYLDAIADDPELLAQVKAFSGQEGHHARAHEAFAARLRAQGLDPDRFLDWYQRWAYGKLEPKVHPVLRLATTVALEHFTAMMAHDALGTGDLDEVHPTMRALLQWHAAEEIEHKSVAFDVLQRVDPRYSVRVAGLVLAIVGLVFYWWTGTLMLLARDPTPAPRILADTLQALRSGRLFDGDLPRAFVAYLRPDFHPSDIDDEALAAGHLDAIGRLAA